MKVLPRLLLVVLLLAAAARPGSGCGPDFPQAVYTGRAAPDAPIENYAAGKLGIVQPTYARRYLIVAYNYLNSRPLTASEQAAFTGDKKLLTIDQDLQIAYAHWREARKQIIDDSRLGDTPDVDRLIAGQQYQSYENCLPDAFETAARTLNARIASHRKDNYDLEHWVSGQDVVFGNCKTGASVPSSLANVPKWLQQDRAYQIASAYFYGADFRSARMAYSEIAADSASPWATAASYLVARTYLREATLTADKPNLAMLRQAQQHLESLLRSKKAGPYASSAHGLLNYIRFRTEPAVQTIALAKAISAPGEDLRFGQDVTDLTLLLDRETLDDGERRQSELLDWIATMQSTGKAGADHALERWRASKKELWLVAALTIASPDSAEARELIDAARVVPASSPAFASAVYHRAQMLNAAHRGAEVRAQLDEILPDARASQPLSTVNALQDQRMMAADSLSDFFAHLVRRPANYGSTFEELNSDHPGYETLAQAALAGNLCAADQKESDEERALRFDEGGAALLNQSFPLAQIEAGIENEPMPSHLRFELATAAWTRAALLGDTTVADHLVSRLSACDPRLRPFLMQYREAKSPDAKRFAAVYMVLHFPGLQPFVSTNLARTTDLGKIDEYRRNWWCADAAPVPVTTAALPFLSDTMIAQAKREQAVLRQDDPAARYLALQSVEWAKANRADPRSPEALALSVRATRYGCVTNSDGGAASKAAFDLLHAQYPNSVWAKKYPYWFKD